MVMPSSRHKDADLQQIHEVCPPCDHYIEISLECRLLYAQAPEYLQIFDDKRCRPRVFLIRFFTIRLRRTGETNVADRAEDLAHTVVHRLLERSQNPSFLSRDLIGQRRFLAARAQQILIDERRRAEGRMRCGNCRHHGRGERGQRVCRHPRGDHYWSGREVVASEDPRRFDPPCERYEARLGPKSLEEAPQGWEPAAAGPDPLAVLEESESLSIATECFGAVQKESPELWRILQLFFFEQRTLGEIASSLGVSSKTVLRRKTEALALLQTKLAARGVRSLEAIV
jgi:RNA polymerase sigma factor (sigma-70 family)